MSLTASAIQMIENLGNCRVDTEEALERKIAVSYLKGEMRENRPFMGMALKTAERRLGEFHSG